MTSAQVQPSSVSDTTTEEATPNASSFFASTVTDVDEVSLDVPVVSTSQGDDFADVTSWDDEDVQGAFPRCFALVTGASRAGPDSSYWLQMLTALHTVKVTPLAHGGGVFPFTGAVPLVMGSVLHTLPPGSATQPVALVETLLVKTFPEGWEAIAASVQAASDAKTAPDAKTAAEITKLVSETAQAAQTSWTSALTATPSDSPLPFPRQACLLSAIQCSEAAVLKACKILSVEPPAGSWPTDASKGLIARQALEAALENLKFSSTTQLITTSKEAQLWKQLRSFADSIDKKQAKPDDSPQLGTASMATLQFDDLAKCRSAGCILPPAPGMPWCVTHLIAPGTGGSSAPVGNFGIAPSLMQGPGAQAAHVTGVVGGCSGLSKEEDQRQKSMASLQGAAAAMPSLATTQHQLNPSDCDTVVDKYRQSALITTQMFLQSGRASVNLPVGMQQALLSGDGDTTIKCDGKAPQRLDQGMRLILFNAILQHCLAFSIPALSKADMDAIVEFRFHDVFAGVVLQQHVRIRNISTFENKSHAAELRRTLVKVDNGAMMRQYFEGLCKLAGSIHGADYMAAVLKWAMKFIDSCIEKFISIDEAKNVWVAHWHEYSLALKQWASGFMGMAAPRPDPTQFLPNAARILKRAEHQGMVRDTVDGSWFGKTMNPFTTKSDGAGGGFDNRLALRANDGGGGGGGGNDRGGGGAGNASHHDRQNSRNRTANPSEGRNRFMTDALKRLDTATTPHSQPIRQKLVRIIEGDDNRRVCFNLMANKQCRHGDSCRFVCHHNIGQT